MSHDALVAGSFVSGMTLVFGGFLLNRLQGGALWLLPIYYKPAAMYVYFGGVAIFLAGIGAAEIFY